MIGRTITHYEVTAKIGAGGMGEVYRARDLMLGREVAIKILPADISAGVEERERLKREAKTLAALNHPNIVTVYSVEEEDGVNFVTMELLAGNRLDKIINQKPLEKDRFVHLAMQLLDAVRAAHQQGIVHRDLKPANIVITPDERVKVLDFGISKMLPLGPAQNSYADAQDLSTRLMTQPGLILGTIAYLSPEQAQGRRIDHRSDIFSLGIVLYQMCTGRHPFQTDSIAGVLTSILRDAPTPFENPDPWTTQVRRIIERCLEKNVEARYQQVAEIIDDLKALHQDGSSATGTLLTADLVQAGRSALSEHSWSQAFAYLRQADADTGLSPGDLECLAEAAWWNGKIDECCEFFRRAYAGYSQAQQPRRAALMAVRLSEIFFHKAARVVSAGWLKRAEKLLQDAQDSVEYGYLLRFKTVIALEIEGNVEAALQLARQTFEIGTRANDKDLVAYGIQDQGRALVDRGQLKEGMELLDESMAFILGGELNPLTVAKTYCNMISVCERTADYRRASEWTEEARHWCVAHEGSPFPGICSVHRAEIMRLSGALHEAEREAQQVCADSRGYIDVAGAAFYEIGEIKLRRRDYEGAEQAFHEAHQRGHDPVPGLPMLLLARGNTEAAKNLINRALAATEMPLSRARLLPAHIGIAVSAGDFETAGQSVEELESIGSQFGAVALRAAAFQGRGNLEIAKRDLERGTRSLRQALDLWLKTELPYEAAITRTQLAQAYRELGDETSALLELNSARAAFEKLDASESAS